MSWLKTKSSTFLIAGIALMVIGAAAVVITIKFQPTTMLRVGDGVFTARIAYTQEARSTGLSNTSELPERQALIMAFPSDGMWGIWMKDMNYPIDIVWLNSDKKVIYTVKNAPPEGSTKVVYVPISPARYVIELPAGTVERVNIQSAHMGVFDIKHEEVR